MTDQPYVHELIDRFARNQPDAVAISFAGRHVTYGELLRRTGAVARQLHAAGVGPDDLVGIPANRSISSLVAMLGVLTSGAGYVAFHGRPAQRFENVLSKAALRVFAGGADALAEVPTDVGVRVATDLELGPGPEPGECVISRPHQANTAYAVFTSGTTGAPKGIVISHGSLAYSTAARPGVFPKPSAYLMLSPLVVDAAAAGIYFTLTTGGRLILPTDEEVMDPGLLADLIEHERVTHLDGVPSQYAALVAYCGEALCDLRCVILAGEALPTSLVRRHFAVAPETPLFNEYGPTEGTVWCTVNEFSAELTGVSHAIAPIGRAIVDTDVRVLGKDLTELAGGQVGEITLAGPGVARGYLADPALTAAQFVPDPDPTHPGRRVYRTGDLGTSESGVLHYRGRMDRMVKVRGYRIELDEVEASLAAHPGLTGAVVITHETSTGARLAAFAVPRDTGPTVRELKTFLASTLPDYMIPHTWRRIDALPLTPNGKLDRDSLRPPVPGAQCFPGVALAEG